MLQALKLKGSKLFLRMFSEKNKYYLNSKQRGSMILVLTFGVALLAGSMAVATAYMSTTNATIKKVNEDLDLENLQN